MSDLPAVVRAEKQFEIHVGEDVAFAEYRLEPGAIVFPHTVVPEALGGQGIGKRLIEAGLAYARENKLWVKPTCSFFRAYITKRPELLELVHADMRDGLRAA